jgi:NADH:ubiquinone oxidoreductase subunit 2 (subunit N)
LAKLGVIEAAESTQSYVLATVAMASAAVAAFFYLRVAVTMFSPVGRSGAVPTSEDASQHDASLAVPTPQPDAAPGAGIASLEVLTDAPPEADVIERGIQPVPSLTAIAIGLCVAVTVVFGIIPGPLLDFAQRATLLIVGG